MPDPRRIADRLKIVSPCSADWTEMTGTDRVRFCSHCDLSVHDASRMTRADLEALVRASNGRLCLRTAYDPRGRVRAMDSPSAPPVPTLVPLVRRASRFAAAAMTVALVAGAVAPAAGVQAAPPAAAARVAAKPSGGVGAVWGTVLDVQGGAVPGASVQITNDSSGITLEAATGSDGAYGFDVPEGTYTIKVEASGFNTAVMTDVLVAVGQTTTSSITLEIPPLGESIGGVVAATPAAYDLVWHSEERDKAGVDAERSSPPLVGADDVEAAIRESPDVDERDAYGDTALMDLAANPELAKLLLEAGADPNASDMYGATPLMRVALYDNVESVQILLKAGAWVDARDSAGLTALMVAASCGNTDVVKALIAAGADVRAVDARGESPLSYARKEEEKAVVKILRKAGAR